ncbi:MAG: DUF420 domain-containing protein [Myxococcales bacterium]|nr:DUF420 domain-containing protein [Myxococcales bacterium]
MGDLLAAVNACLNGTAGVLLLLGRCAIKRKLVALHRKLMVSAFVVSSVFLVCYLTRVYLTGTHKFPGTGWSKTLYLAVLLSHMALASVTPFLAIRSLQLALTRRIEQHRRLVRFTWPIWMYVSVTGVIVYLMLYRPI